ncbi:MAG: DUF1844 domain-containing protein [bacterium]
MDDESQNNEITFQDFVFMLSSSALIGLGHVPNPITNKYETNLESVKQTISLLEMIQKKTKGNLSKEEDDLLDSVLHELRMGFIAKAKEGPTEPPKPPEQEEEKKPSRIIIP